MSTKRRCQCTTKQSQYQDQCHNSAQAGQPYCYTHRHCERPYPKISTTSLRHEVQEPPSSGLETMDPLVMGQIAQFLPTQALGRLAQTSRGMKARPELQKQLAERRDYPTFVFFPFSPRLWSEFGLKILQQEDQVVILLGQVVYQIRLPITNTDYGGRTKVPDTIVSMHGPITFGQIMKKLISFYEHVMRRSNRIRHLFLPMELLPYAPLGLYLLNDGTYKVYFSLPETPKINFAIGDPIQDDQIKKRLFVQKYQQIKDKLTTIHDKLFTLEHQQQERQFRQKLERQVHEWQTHQAQERQTHEHVHEHVHEMTSDERLTTIFAESGWNALGQQSIDWSETTDPDQIMIPQRGLLLIRVISDLSEDESQYTTLEFAGPLTIRTVGERLNQYYMDHPALVEALTNSDMGYPVGLVHEKDNLYRLEIE